MNRLKQLFTLFLLLTIVASCSTPKRSITHRSNKKASTRKRIPKKDIADLRLRDEVLIHAIQHVGRNYKYGGKSPRSGFDCSGLVSFSFGKAGLDMSGASHHQAEIGKWKSRSDLEPGDLIFFGKNKKISHVAIVVSNENGRLEIIHSTSSRGVVVDEISQSRYWNSRYLFGKDVIGNNTNVYTSR
ncbi:MAG: C40 family peptidase [Saprospiraceae bacterium]|nr:C40 family peptidase [Saprospiraceae bacterium]